MAQSARKILKQALLLPDHERAEVIAELLDSLPPPGPSEARSEEEWIAGVERRGSCEAGRLALGYIPERSAITLRGELACDERGVLLCLLWERSAAISPKR